MGTEMLASRSGETMELKSIVVLVVTYCSLCLSCDISLSLSHTIALFVYEQDTCCHLSETAGTKNLLPTSIDTSGAIYRIFPFYLFSSNRKWDGLDGSTIRK